MSKNKKQPISEVAIIILDEIENCLIKIDNLNDNNTGIKNELSGLKSLLDKSKSVLALIERVNQKHQDI